jgi:hypothetical protein
MFVPGIGVVSSLVPIHGDSARDGRELLGLYLSSKSELRDDDDFAQLLESRRDYVFSKLCQAIFVAVGDHSKEVVREQAPELV